MTNDNIITYIYTIIYILVYTKQCRTLLDYHTDRWHLNKNIVHYMYSTQNRHCNPSLHHHSDVLKEELAMVGLRLSSLSPDEPTNVRQKGQGLRTKGTRGLHRKGRKVVGGAKVRVLSPGSSACCSASLATAQASGSQCDMWWHKGVWACCIPH